MPEELSEKAKGKQPAPLIREVTINDFVERHDYCSEDEEAQFQRDVDQAAQQSRATGAYGHPCNGESSRVQQTRMKRSGPVAPIPISARQPTPPADVPSGNEGPAEDNGFDSDDETAPKIDWKLVPKALKKEAERNLKNRRWQDQSRYRGPIVHYDKNMRGKVVLHCSARSCLSPESPGTYFLRFHLAGQAARAPRRT